jgi:hypothetical protein
MAYEIRVRNHLEACWEDWFDGWGITNLENGEVLLTNPAADQSALHGVLNKIHDLNLKLISVETVNGGSKNPGAGTPDTEEAGDRKGDST